MNEKFKKETSSSKSNLNDSELLEVAGGESQPEEFDWRKLSNYEGPEKTDSLWSFSAEANVEGQYFKKKNEGK